MRELGRGGFGWVFLANSHDSGREVAVKLLHGADEGQKARFARELRILQEQINNRYVVDVIDANLANVPPFIVLEYCAGGSLRAWVEQRREWKDVAGALLHATLGLRDIHRVGGFHRDIKPDNLLLGTFNGTTVVKVADFGVARTPDAASGTMTRSAWGTDGYFAPEVKAGGEHTPKSDVYALGVTGIELLTGSKDPARLAGSDAPRGLIELLGKMVSAAPAMRPSTDVLAQVLQQIISATPPSPPPEAKRPTSGSGGLGALLAFAGAAAAVAALVAHNDREWDANVGRYRGSDGKFR